MSSPDHAHAYEGAHAHARPNGWWRWVDAANDKDWSLVWDETVAAAR